MVIDDPAKETDQLFAFVDRERREQLVLDFRDEPIELTEQAPSGWSDGDDVTALVGGVGRACNETLFDQFVDRGNHVAAIDSAAVAQRSLASWPNFVERREQRVMVAAGSDAGESFRDEPAGSDRGLIDEPTRQAFQFCWRSTGSLHGASVSKLLGVTNE